MTSGVICRLELMTSVELMTSGVVCPHLGSR